MISLSALFYILVILFIMIGAMRGWAKEMLVSFSIILAIFIIVVIMPMVVKDTTPERLFFLRVAVIIGCAFFGYQTPNFRRIAESGRFIRNAARDVIMGSFVGAINGYLIVGSLWFYLATAGYPFPQISAPDGATEAGIAAMRILDAALPGHLAAPNIYYAIAISFVIVLVMFI